mmetsp:Transcript_36116/g.77017  ORF Transcript_36116/g.77017 Transcript_36116/m.77017 type:complete len:205 (-) Transcript_36116:235-849(-)
MLFFLSHCNSSVNRSSRLCSEDRSGLSALSSFRYVNVCLRGSTVAAAAPAAFAAAPFFPATFGLSATAAAFLTIPNFLTRSFPTVTSSRVSIRFPSMVTIRSPTWSCPRKVQAGSMCVIFAPPSGTMARVRPSRPGETVSMRRDGKGGLDDAASFRAAAAAAASSSYFFNSSLSLSFFSALLSVCLEVGLTPSGFLQFLHLQCS